MIDEPDWPAIIEALQHNPEYQAASAEVEALDALGPPREAVDVGALFRELRGDRS